MREQVTSQVNLWIRRLFMLLIGIAVTEFGSQLFVALHVGADPFMILVQGISRQTGFSYGQSSTLLMLICLAIIFFVDRRRIYAGTVFCIFCLGPLVDFYAFLFSQIIPQQRSLWLTALLVATGCIIVSIGMGISVRSEAGACSNDLIPVIAHEKFPALQLRWCRMLFDGLCIFGGFFLGGTLGIGTVIALTLYGPGLQFFLPVAGKIAAWLHLPSSLLDGM